MSQEKIQEIIKSRKNTQEEYNFELSEFSGPLDLLLHLSKTHEIDLKEVSLNELIDQYVIFIQTVRSSGINVAASYLEMLAELLRIKSKMMIMENFDEDLLEEAGLSPEQLITRLMEYKKFKDVSYVFSTMRDKRYGGFSKHPSNLKMYRENNTKELLSMDKLTSALKEFYKQEYLKELEEKVIEHNEIKIEDCMDDILAEIVKPMSIVDLIYGKKKIDMVIFILGILELAKNGLVKIAIKENDVLVEKVEENGK